MRWFLAVLIGLTLFAGCGKKDNLPGQKTLAVFDVPAEDLEKMTERKAGYAFTHSWSSEPIKLSVTDNPLTAVVEYEGHTTAAGPATNILEVSWEREQGSPLYRLPFTPDSSQAVNQTYARTMATPPVSFKKAETVSVGLHLDKHYNLVPDKVRITVRSGISSNTWIETLFAFRWLMVPVVMVGLMVLFRR